jgi:hypothetical protein
VDYKADLLNLRTAGKLKLPHFAEGEADQEAAAEGKHCYQLRKSIALTTLHDLAKLPHLTISI